MDSQFFSLGISVSPITDHRLQSLCFLLLSSNVQLSAMSFGLICRNVDRSQSVFYFVPQAGSTTEMWSSWTELLMYLCAFNVFLCLIFHLIFHTFYSVLAFDGKGGNEGWFKNKYMNFAKQCISIILQDWKSQFYYKTI